MIHCDSLLSLQQQLQNKTLGRIGLVPTMGNLHNGHLSLIKQIKAHCDTVVVSIFVNPSQFGPNEDFDSYPRTINDDLEKLKAVHTDIIFTPTAQDVYPRGYASSSVVHVPRLSELYCGKTRPQFFDGVCSVVSRLLLMTQANVAIFGEKDFQQLQIIKKMVTDLFIPVDIISAPIVREDNGLAMSSRNQYLSDDDKIEATSIHKGLLQMKRLFNEGDTNPNSLINAFQAELSQTIIKDYCVIVDPISFDQVSLAKSGCRVLFAGTLNACRLIDNIAL